MKISIGIFKTAVDVYDALARITRLGATAHNIAIVAPKQPLLDDAKRISTGLRLDQSHRQAQRSDIPLYVSGFLSRTLRGELRTSAATLTGSLTRHGISRHQAAGLLTAVTEGHTLLVARTRAQDSEWVIEGMLRANAIAVETARAIPREYRQRPLFHRKYLGYTENLKSITPLRQGFHPPPRLRPAGAGQASPVVTPKTP